MRSAILILFSLFTCAKTWQEGNKLTCYKCENCPRVNWRETSKDYDCSACYMMLKDFDNGTIIMDRGCMRQQCEDDVVHGNGYTGTTECCETDLCNRRPFRNPTVKPPFLQTTTTTAKPSSTSNSISSTTTTVSTTSKPPVWTTIVNPWQGKKLTCYQCENCPRVRWRETSQAYDCNACYMMLKDFDNGTIIMDRGCMRQQCEDDVVHGNGYTGTTECCETNLCNRRPFRNPTVKPPFLQTTATTTKPSSTSNSISSTITTVSTTTKAPVGTTIVNPWQGNKLACYECENCSMVRWRETSKAYDCTACYMMLKDFDNGTIIMDRGCMRQQCEDDVVHGNGYTGTTECCETNLCNSRRFRNPTVKRVMSPSSKNSQIYSNRFVF